MGFSKFIMKHGPGSPGAVAKVLAREYRSLVEHNRAATADEILRDIYLSRMAAAETLGKAAKYHYSRDPTHLDRIVEEAQGNLGLLVWYILALESPHLYSESAPPPARGLWNEVHEAVTEVLDREAPGWRQMSTKHLSTVDSKHAGATSPNQDETRRIIACPSCSQRLHVPNRAGIATCPSCGSNITVQPEHETDSEAGLRTEQGRGEGSTTTPMGTRLGLGDDVLMPVVDAVLASIPRKMTLGQRMRTRRIRRSPVAKDFAEKAVMAFFLSLVTPSDDLSRAKEDPEFLRLFIDAVSALLADALDELALRAPVGGRIGVTEEQIHNATRRVAADAIREVVSGIKGTP